jgi:hypothetical protein
MAPALSPTRHNYGMRRSASRDDTALGRHDQVGGLVLLGRRRLLRPLASLRLKSMRGPLLYSRFLRAPIQFSKRAAGETAEFSRSGVEFPSVIGAARLECGEPAAEPGELIWRQVGNRFGDFFNFHVPQYSTGARALLSDGIAIGSTVLEQRHSRVCSSGFPNTQAYDLAYDKLYEALPNCQNCTCPCEYWKVLALSDRSPAAGRPMRLRSSSFRVAALFSYVVRPHVIQNLAAAHLPPEESLVRVSACSSAQPHAPLSGCRSCEVKAPSVGEFYESHDNAPSTTLDDVPGTLGKVVGKLAGPAHEVSLPVESA